MAKAEAGPRADEPVVALCEAAVLHAEAGRWAAAEEACRRLLEAEPGHADGLHLFGLIHAQRGEVDPAIELVARAIRSDQTRPVYFADLGTLLARRGRLDEAFKSFDIALGLKPDFVEVWLALGDLLTRQGRLAEAQLACEHALELAPGNAAAAAGAARRLQEQGRFEEAVAAYRRWAGIDPDNYDARNDLGSILVGLGRFEEAAAAFEQAGELRPDAPAAFNNRGIALTHLRRCEEAVACLDRAIALAPRLAEPRNARANALKMLNRFEEALADYDRAILLKPDYAEAHGNRGTCLDDLARPEEARASYRRALALQPQHADTHWNLAVNRLRAGDFQAGWREAEWRWTSSSLKLESRDFDRPAWLGAEPIDGKVLLLHNEQGLGDAIQFCRYIPLLAARGARVVLEIARPLHALLSAMPGVAQCIARGEAIPDFDCHCALSSLPLAFDTTLPTIPASAPYLAPAQPARDWNAWLGQDRRPRIGLVWSGNPGHLNDHNRSVAFASLAPLLDLDARFVSLQKNPRDGDQAALRAHGGILDAAPELQDFADTAGLVAQLDLVISVDTSVAHLTGALGRPVFVLLPYVADWRWLSGRTDSPWYPTARLFRQTEARSWESVICEVREALQRLIAAAR